MSDVEIKGWNQGWTDAERFARGGKQDRAEVAKRWRKSGLSISPFWCEYRRIFRERATDFADAIKAGRVRGCRPGRIYSLVYRD